MSRRQLIKTEIALRELRRMSFLVGLCENPDALIRGYNRLMREYGNEENLHVHLEKFANKVFTRLSEIHAEETRTQLEAVHEKKTAQWRSNISIWKRFCFWKS